MGDYQHRPVLLEEVVEALNIRPDGKYLDGTFGRGGHSQAILAGLSKQGCLFTLDRDPEAVTAGKELLGNDPRFSIVQGNYAELERYVHEWGVEEGLDGILLDLGVSSPQLDNPDRGFSFMGDGPLEGMEVGFTGLLLIFQFLLPEVSFGGVEGGQDALLVFGDMLIDMGAEKRGVVVPDAHAGGDDQGDAGLEQLVGDPAETNFGLICSLGGLAGG